MRRRLPAVVLLLMSACQRQTTQGPQGGPPPSLASGPVGQARQLFEQGRLDQALAKLQEAPGDPESLYFQGAVWAKKAESAPLPTPPPAPSPLPWGAAPPAAPELKPEEVTALDFYEKALAARADHSHAHLGIAELLAPHAIRKQEVELAKKKSRPPRRGKAVEPTPEPATGPDWTPERVIREYRAAWQADPKSKAAVEGLIRFAGRVGRLDDAEAGLQELTQRDPERPEPFIHLADFLINDKKDPLGAVEQYKQALVWRADDDATRAKIADIYIAMGIEHWNAGQWSLADSRFKEAQKFVTDRNSPQGLKVRDYTGRLADIRHR